MPPRDERALSRRFGLDLGAINDSLGKPVDEVLLITSLASPDIPRSSFKLRLDDGSWIKARIFETAHEALNVRKLREYIVSKHFPMIIDVLERVMLIQWIEGKPLLEKDWDSSLLKTASRIQAFLHWVPIPLNQNEQGLADMQFYHDILDQRIGFLSSMGYLSDMDRSLIREVIRGSDSTRPEIGLCHGDYCAENMILDPKGQLFIIDLETLSISATVYDLARTLYRWPLSTAQRRYYLDAYQAHHSAEDFIQAMAFWMIFVLVQSAEFRSRGKTGGLQRPLLLLKRVIRCSNEWKMFQCFDDI